MAADDKSVAVAPSPTEEKSGSDVLKEMTPTQRAKWRVTGELPEAKKEEPAQVSTNGESSTPAKTEVSAPGKVETPAESVPAKKEEPKQNAETRIKNLLAENKELKKKLDEITAKPAATPAKIEEPAKPRRDDIDTKTGKPLYATDEEYLDARDRYIADMASRQTRQQIAKEESDRRVAEQNQLIVKRFENSLKIAKERHADFLTVVGEQKIEKDGKKITVFEAPGIKAIKTNGIIDSWTLDSSEGSEMLYYFATRPEEVERIQALSAFEQARELTKLEEKLAKPESKPAESSPAPGKQPPKVPPEPASSVGGKGTAPTDEVLAATEAGDFRRFKKAADAEEIAARKKGS